MAEVIHVHTSPRFRVNCSMGSLVFRHQFRAHAKTKTPLAPEPVGHFTHLNRAQDDPYTSNVHLEKPRENGDSPIPNTLFEAETFKPGLDMGQEGRAVLDKAASKITRLRESSMNTTKAVRSWNRGKTFGGGRGL